MRRHPGYEHIHKILDFNDQIPCIVSNPHQQSLAGISFPVVAKAEMWVPHRSDQFAWCNAAQQICQAVDYMHYMGFAHMDIKPGNFLCDMDEFNHLKIYLTDFGGVQPLNSPPKFLTGTPGFAAPELYTTDPNTLDMETLDKYSVAVTLLVLLGTLPNGQNSYSPDTNTMRSIAAGIFERTPNYHLRTVCTVVMAPNLETRKVQYDQLLKEVGAQRDGSIQSFRQIMPPPPAQQPMLHDAYF